MSEKILSKIVTFFDEVVWPLFFVHIFAHAAGIAGLYLIVTGQCKVLTLLCGFFFFLIAGIGLGPGSHKYFSHKSFKATPILHVFMLYTQTTSGIESAYSWTRMHRVHHKFQDTPPDPLYMGRGLFYVYFTRWFMKEPKEFVDEAKKIWMDDFESDKLIMFQHRFYPLCVTVCSAVIPTLIPIILFNEAPHIAFGVCMFRWLCTWTQYAVSNSFAHLYGYRPHDKNFSARNLWLWQIILLGEGYHNFHHTFPFDYRSCERDDRMDFFNWGCVFIDWMAAWNQSYDLRIASPQLIAKRSLRTGDGSRAFDPDVNEPEIWEDKNGNLLNLDDEVKAQDSQFEVYRLKAL